MDRNIEIDWKWVEAHTSTREKIEKIGDGQAKEAVLDHLKEAIDIAKSKAAPATSVAKLRILKFNSDSLELDNGVTFLAKELSSSLKGATHIYAFLVTIGKGLEEAASSYMNSGNHLLGYLLDRIGSFAVESLAETMESDLRSSLAPSGLGVSMRFSPGYCDWRIEEQFKLAGIIDFARAGVTLNESCMMTPKKSISAIVGIGPRELFSKKISPCTVCPMKVCEYRRID